MHASYVSEAYIRRAVENKSSFDAGFFGVGNYVGWAKSPSRGAAVRIRTDRDFAHADRRRGIYLRDIHGLRLEDVGSQAHDPVGDGKVAVAHPTRVPTPAARWRLEKKGNSAPSERITIHEMHSGLWSRSRPVAHARPAHLR